MTVRDYIKWLIVNLPESTDVQVELSLDGIGEVADCETGNKVRFQLDTGVEHYHQLPTKE